MTTKQLFILEKAFGEESLLPATVEKVNELFEQSLDYVYPAIKEIAEQIGHKKFMTKKAVLARIDEKGFSSVEAQQELISFLLQHELNFKVEFSQKIYNGPVLPCLVVDWKQNFDFEQTAFDELSFFEDKKSKGISLVVDESEYHQAQSYKCLKEANVSAYKSEIGYIRSGLEFISQFSHRDVSYKLIDVSN